jgi:hypothetical protein
MASEKHIAANRMNAQKSRGLRSARGKARASRNALRQLHKEVECWQKRQNEPKF